MRPVLVNDAAATRFVVRMLGRASPGVLANDAAATRFVVRMLGRASPGVLANDPATIRFVYRMSRWDDCGRPPRSSNAVRLGALVGRKEQQVATHSLS